MDKTGNGDCVWLRIGGSRGGTLPREREGSGHGLAVLGITVADMSLLAECQALVRASVPKASCMLMLVPPHEHWGQRDKAI